MPLLSRQDQRGYTVQSDDDADSIGTFPGVPSVVQPSAVQNPRPTQWPLCGIQKPGANDCLTGRGGGTNHHIGNIKYRQIVDANKAAYKAANREQKGLITTQIVSQWRAQVPPGRFLKVNDQTSPPSWDDIGEEGAKNKVSQSLREKRLSKLTVDQAGSNIGLPTAAAPRSTIQSAPVLQTSTVAGGQPLAATLATQATAIGQAAQQNNVATLIQGFHSLDNASQLLFVRYVMNPENWAVARGNAGATSQTQQPVPTNETEDGARPLKKRAMHPLESNAEDGALVPSPFQLNSPLTTNDAGDTMVAI